MGYLDGYGVADARKERTRKRVILWGLAAIVVGVVGYFNLRTWSEERVVKEFFATLDRKDFQGAYKMFGCSQEKPCKYYDTKQFNEDWGPDSPHAKGSDAQVVNVDFCDDTVVFLVNYPKAEPVSLFVDRATKVVGFASAPRCPGRHWEFKRFFQNLFGSDKA